MLPPPEPLYFVLGNSIVNVFVVDMDADVEGETTVLVFDLDAVVPGRRRRMMHFRSYPWGFASFNSRRQDRLVVVAALSQYSATAQKTN